jgi:diguanylate cyclase (GGDEF)-like protein
MAEREKRILAVLMYTFRHSGRLIPKTAAFLSWPVLLLVWALSPPTASAACIANTDHDIQVLQTLVAKNATQALKEVQDRLDALGHDPLAAQHDSSRLASLYAVQAGAYGILELSTEARTAASEGLRLATNIHNPVHLELLSLYAENVYDAAGIADQIKAIERARIAQTRGSSMETCLLITRGVLEHRQDRADLAIVSLTQAYAASASSTVTEPHVLSGSALSVVMRDMGDYEQALALNQEELDWDMSQGATLSLSVSRYMRGQILKLMGRYKAAIAEFTEARKLSVILNDSQGVGYADLRICEAHIELAEFALAQQECANALRIFSAAQSADTLKETQALLARIDLGLGRADSALATLNGVLDHNGIDLPPLHVASLYDSRARANAALHHYRNAYGDLREYLQRYTAANDAELHRQAGALRGRFDTDREIERNASLKRELTLSREQSNRQAQQLRWNAIVVVVGVCVIALLIYFLFANFRYRQQLIKLASQDSLTGLPNRRHTTELATAALQAARTTHQPLTLAIIDMDHFKIINDRCGHATGDYVLREFARAGGDALRDTDLLGRWGGEEFLLVMPGATLEVALANLERLRTLVFGIRLPASGVGLRVSLSAGLVAFDSNVKSLDDLIARADGALYAAKNDGRDLVRIADASTITGSHAIRRLQRQ